MCGAGSKTECVTVVIGWHCRYITKQDFNNLSWDTLMLLGGGLSLGTVVDSSGLLLVVGDGMSSLLEGAPVFVVLLAF